MDEKKQAIVLESSRSIQISLEAIREGEAGLNPHRQSMLNRVPEVGDFASFRHESIELVDLAYLTAKTGHEFALLRGKENDILFHGEPLHCDFLGDLAELLKAHKLVLVGHSHPGEDNPIPSTSDRLALSEIGQKKSAVVSGRTGKIRMFGQSPFEELDD